MDDDGAVAEEGPRSALGRKVGVEVTIEEKNLAAMTVGSEIEEIQKRL